MKIKILNKGRKEQRTVTVDFDNKTYTRKDTTKNEYDFLFEIKKDNFDAFEVGLGILGFTKID